MNEKQITMGRKIRSTLRLSGTGGVIILRGHSIVLVALLYVYRSRLVEDIGMVLKSFTVF